VSKSKSGKTRVPVEPHNTLKINAQPGVDKAVILATTALRPSVRAAMTTQGFAKPAIGDVDVTSLANELSAQIAAVRSGDLGRAEAMLISQAHVLEALFHELARRAGANMGEYLQAAETYMRLALKAQSQCRATLETLATIKNPPIAFVRQANIAHGPQQVNNTPVAATSRARELEITPNKLLETDDGQPLDVGAATQTVGADPQVEAMGTLDRTQDS
jgi:hypothetical protein